MDHPNVVKFHEISYETRGADTYLILVMDYYPFSLQDLIDKRAKDKKPHFLKRDFQVIVKSVLCGLEHMHCKGIAHRDIKPDNILIDPNRNKVVVADIGSAKKVNDGSYNKSYICSRVYRA